MAVSVAAAANMDVYVERGVVRKRLRTRTTMAKTAEKVSAGVINRYVIVGIIRVIVGISPRFL